MLHACRKGRSFNWSAVLGAFGMRALCVLGSAAEAVKARLTKLKGPVRGWGRTPHPGNQAMDGLFAGPAQSGERPNSSLTV